MHIRRAVDFFSFFWGWEDSWLPFVIASSAGSFLSPITILQCSWSPQERCFISSPPSPLVESFSSAGGTHVSWGSVPATPQHLPSANFSSQTNVDEQGFKNCLETFVSNSLPIHYHFSGTYDLFLTRKLCRWDVELQFREMLKVLLQKNRGCHTSRSSTTVTTPEQESNTLIPWQNRISSKVHVSAYISTYTEHTQSNSRHSSECFWKVLWEALFLVELNAVPIIQKLWNKGQKAASYILRAIKSYDLSSSFLFILRIV